MKRLSLILVLTLAAGAITAYAMHRPIPAEPLPAVQGDVPRIVIVGKREHVADRDR